jgi:acyl-CoA synthetase (NDP forming)
MRTLQGLSFTGELYPVNPRYEEVLGLRCYASLTDLPEVPDAVFIGLSATACADVLRTAGECGIGGAVIHAAGFADAGPRGASRQRELVEIAERYDIALCGPNNMGVLNVLDRSGLWTLPSASLVPGPVAIISQSGSAAIALTQDPHRTGLAYVLTAGNEAVLDATDYLEFVIADARVRIVLMFIESIRSPQRFAACAHRAAALGKRILAIKVGRSASAQALVRSHTNSIAGDDETYDAFLHQCGVIRVRDFDELLELAGLFAVYPDPPPTPGAVAVMTSGGEAALVADLAASARLQLPELPTASRRRLQLALGTFSLPLNPLDAWGSGWNAERFRDAMSELATGTRIRTIIAVMDAPGSGGGDAHITREVARIFAELRELTGRHFVIVNTTAASGTDPELTDLASELAIPCLSGLTVGLAVIARWAAHRTRGIEPPVRGSSRRPRGFQALADRLGRGELAPEVGAELLRAAGVPMTPVLAVRSGREATRTADRLGYPVVLKGQGDGILHKHALGLVAVGLHDAAAVRSAFSRLEARLASVGAHRPTITMQALEHGAELFIGVRNDRHFGPVTVVGLGGTDVESSRRVAIHVGHLDRRAARGFLLESPAGALLEPSGGAARYDVGAAVGALTQLSSLTGALQETVDSIEINPLMVREQGQGVAGVDLVVVRRTVEPEERSETGEIKFE